ncbi:MAG: hypothetical protein II304_07600 [Bacteroidales bacterium]|nr:hypothetical protein [Bacteroidales bacterium]
MKNFIKVVNPDVANNLVTLGFTYMTENLQGKTVYVFADSVDLRKYLQKNYSCKDFFINNKLCF